MKLMRKSKKQEAERPEDMTDKIIENLITELQEEDGSIQSIEEQVTLHKKKTRRRIGVSVSLIILAAVSLFLFIHLQTYTTARVSTTYTSDSSGNNNYREFAGGVLKYSRDGIVYLDKRSKEVWNQPYQIKTPILDVNENSGAVADKGGNDISVFDKEGLKGEIHTTLPIEKVTVSSQGIVGAVLSDESAPVIVCYDAQGNLLAEIKTSSAGTGYPMDISISENGETLLVSYMSVVNGVAVSRISYYNFGESGKAVSNNQTVSNDYENVIIPETFFMNQNVSVAVGDNQILIYKGDAAPELAKTVTLDKRIKSVFHSSRYIGLVLKNDGEAGYEVCLFNTSGNKVMSEHFTGEYTNVKLSGGQVVMYDGKKCSVFTRTGIHKFEGELDNNILEMFPIFGVNKYIVINADGMEVVRFVK